MRRHVVFHHIRLQRLLPQTRRASGGLPVNGPAIDLARLAIKHAYKLKAPKIPTKHLNPCVCLTQFPPGRGTDTY